MQDLLSVRVQAEALIVEIHAPELDMFMVPDMREAVKIPLQSQPPVVVVRLNSTEYMDSSALGFLFQLYRSVEEYGGRFCLAEVQSRINQLLTINGAQRYLKTYESVEAAISGT